MNIIEEAIKELNKIEEEELIKEALEVEEDNLDQDIPSKQDLEFAEQFKQFIEEIIFREQDLTENFKNRSKLKQHFEDHCIGKTNKTSRRSKVLYDFKDISLYQQHEQKMQSLIGTIRRTSIINSLTDRKGIIKSFHKLFEGDFTLFFTFNCGFMSNDKEQVNLMFHSFANDNTKNYGQNTIDFMMYNRYTKTLYPLDANYLQNKFNNLVIKSNVNKVKPFKINH